MKMVFLFLVVLGLIVLLRWFRAGHGGEIGRRIRNSDHWALEDAIHDKEEEIKSVTEMIYAKEKYYREYAKDNLAILRLELDNLISLRPKYPLEEKRVDKI